MKDEMMSNMKSIRNMILAVVAVVLTVAAFTGCRTTGEPEFRLAIDT